MDELRQVVCASGFLRECHKWEGGQVTLRVVPPGGHTDKHRHNRTDERWWLASGSLYIKKEWEGFEVAGLMRAGDAQEVPAGTWHHVFNGGDEPAVLVFWASRCYDPDDPDKEPWDEG